MTESHLLNISDQLANAVTAIAPSVIQVQGRRRPATGVVYSHDAVLTTMRAVGRDDNLRVRTHDGRTLDATLHGWDPATSLALLRATNLSGPTTPVSEAPPRVGHIALAVARSWSNAITASAGIISIIGGPLSTGRGRTVDEILRTTAPMHDGFAGGAFIDVNARLIGITTAATIRGLGVVIPASIAWKTAATLLEHGGLKRGYIGIAGQSVQLAGRQRGVEQRDRALLVAAVTGGSPADASGIIVGDLLLMVDGRPIESPEDLLELLVGNRVGREVPVRLLRGDRVQEIRLTIGERPSR